MPIKETHPEIHLSLEELALLINLMGYPIVAKGLLTSQLGDISPQEERGRLLAANHTLLAKGMMELRGGKLYIEPAYSDLLDLLPNNDYAVRCVVSSEGSASQMLTYYLRDDQTVQQRITHGAVHSLRAVSSLTQAVEAIQALLMLDISQPHSHEIGYLRQEELEALPESYSDAADASQRLQAVGWAKGTADSFAQDLFNQRLRGAVYRVEMNPEDKEWSERGFMLLTGISDRTWLMTPGGGPDSDSLLIKPATRDLVRDAIVILLKPF